MKTKRRTRHLPYITDISRCSLCERRTCATQPTSVFTASIGTRVYFALCTPCRAKFQIGLSPTLHHKLKDNLETDAVRLFLARAHGGLA